MKQSIWPHDHAAPVLATLETGAAFQYGCLAVNLSLLKPDNTASPNPFISIAAIVEDYDGTSSGGRIYEQIGPSGCTYEPASNTGVVVVRHLLNSALTSPANPSQYQVYSVTTLVSQAQGISFPNAVAVTGGGTVFFLDGNNNALKGWNPALVDGKTTDAVTGPGKVFGSAEPEIIALNDTAGVFVNGTLLQQMTILIHELGHAMNDLFGPGTSGIINDFNNASISDANSALVQNDCIDHPDLPVFVIGGPALTMRQVLIRATLLASVLGIATANRSLAVAPQKATPLTVCDLLSSPLTYNGRTVTVRARSRATKEGEWLQGDGCPGIFATDEFVWDSIVWIERSADAEEASGLIFDTKSAQRTWRRFAACATNWKPNRSAKAAISGTGIISRPLPRSTTTCVLSIITRFAAPEK